jgi:hypothetical protein
MFPDFYRNLLEHNPKNGGLFSGKRDGARRLRCTL